MKSKQKEKVCDDHVDDEAIVICHEVNVVLNGMDILFSSHCIVLPNNILCIIFNNWGPKNNKWN